MRIDTSLLDALSSHAKASHELGQLVESFIVAPCSDVMGFSVELGRWHNTECLESGTVILECKDGTYETLGEEDMLGKA